MYCGIKRWSRKHQSFISKGTEICYKIWRRKNIIRPISNANNKFSSVMNDVLRGSSVDSHCTKNNALSKLTDWQCVSVCSLEDFILDQEKDKLNFNQNDHVFHRPAPLTNTTRKKKISAPIKQIHYILENASYDFSSLVNTYQKTCE